MNERNGKDRERQGTPIPKTPQPVKDAMRHKGQANEKLHPEDLRDEGPDNALEKPAEGPATTTHSGQTTRGSYATDSSTGAGRYQDHKTGTFGVDPLDESTEEPIDPKID
ncbi:MAG TPA: hypothetical protein VKG92_11815 [Flavobacteriales bacterium]|nr:hypothetical protein [Flavobacteriales bacterium]